MSSSMGNYASLIRRIWDDLDFRKLTPDSRLVFVCLRTCPQNNIPCIMELNFEQIEKQTGLPRKRIEKAINSLSKGWIKVESGWVWIRNGLKYDPTYRPTNENHVKGLERAIINLPKMELVSDFIEHYKELGLLPDSLLIAYGKAIEDSKRSSSTESGVRSPDDPEPDPIPITEAENIFTDLEQKAWDLYPPTKIGRNNRKLFREQWEKRIKEGEDPNIIIKGIGAYAQERKEEDSQFTKGIQVFIGHDRHYLNYAGIKKDTPSSFLSPKTQKTLESLEIVGEMIKQQQQKREEGK